MLHTSIVVSGVQHLTESIGDIFVWIDNDMSVQCNHVASFLSFLDNETLNVHVLGRLFGMWLVHHIQCHLAVCVSIERVFVR